MEFYEAISKYYDFIFPTGGAQVDFLKQAAGEPPKKLLDIACGTGGYSLELSKQGYDLTAVDLDYKMVEELKTKIATTNVNIKALQGNMLELTESLDSRFDLAFCIGNSLVHLDGEKEIGEFFKESKSLLVEGGSLVIQTINYDRVLMKDIRFLPTIENDEIPLSFKRLYSYDQARNKILFKTILEVDGRQIENEIDLYPLLSDSVIKLLKLAGFSEIKLYGDFKEGEFIKEDSYSMVVVAS